MQVFQPGPDNFLELADTPLSYSGSGGKVVGVDSGATGLEFVDLLESVDDQVATLIQDGTGISWAYDDGAATLTPTVTLSPFDTDNLAEGSNLYFTDERVDDRVAALLVEGEGLDIVYDDGLGTLTISGEDASTTNKGVASFNSTNFSVTSGAVNTVQNIDTGASPTFVAMTLSGLTASRVVVSDGSKVLTSSSVTTTEIGYMSGVTAAVQTQLDNKQPLDATLTAFAALTITQGGIIYGTGTDTFAVLAKSATATRYLANTGTNNNPAWAQVNLANGVTGTLPDANLESTIDRTIFNASDYITALGGVHVGGASDPGTDTLIVDGPTTLNESGGNNDTRMESDTVTSAFLLDADGGTGAGKITTAVPTQLGLGFGVEASTTRDTLTLSGDVLTIDENNGVIIVQSQTGTTDNFDNITGGYDGQVIFVVAAFTHTISIRPNTVSGENIFTYNDDTVAIDVSEMAMFVRQSTNWYQITPQADVF